MAFEKLFLMQYRHQCLPLGPSDRFFRSQILLNTIRLQGSGACIAEAFDGEEGKAGSTVGGGCWSWWWPSGKQRQERALASRRPAMCRNFPGGEA
jgi:hypothetical protein